MSLCRLPPPLHVRSRKYIIFLSIHLDRREETREIRVTPIRAKSNNFERYPIERIYRWPRTRLLKFVFSLEPIISRAPLAVAAIVTEQRRRRGNCVVHSLNRGDVLFTCDSGDAQLMRQGRSMIPRDRGLRHRRPALSATRTRGSRAHAPSGEIRCRAGIRFSLFSVPPFMIFLSFSFSFSFFSFLSSPTLSIPTALPTRRNAASPMRRLAANDNL